MEALREGLRELGYVEDKNIVIEWRSAEGKLDRLSELVAELVRLKVDVIVTGGPRSPALSRTPPGRFPSSWRRIPILLETGSLPAWRDPVGILLDCPSPQEINGKRLELLKEVVPKLSRVALLGISTYPGNSLSLKETELAAEA